MKKRTLQLVIEISTNVSKNLNYITILKRDIIKLKSMCCTSNLSTYLAPVVRQSFFQVIWKLISMFKYCIFFNIYHDRLCTFRQLICKKVHILNCITQELNEEHCCIIYLWIGRENKFDRSHPINPRSNL